MSEIPRPSRFGFNFEQAGTVSPADAQGEDVTDGLLRTTDGAKVRHEAGWVRRFDRLPGGWRLGGFDARMRPSAERILRRRAHLGPRISGHGQIVSAPPPHDTKQREV